MKTAPIEAWLVEKRVIRTREAVLSMGGCMEKMLFRVRSSWCSCFHPPLLEKSYSVLVEAVAHLAE